MSGTFAFFRSICKQTNKTSDPTGNSPINKHFLIQTHLLSLQMRPRAQNSYELYSLTIQTKSTVPILNKKAWNSDGNRYTHSEKLFVANLNKKLKVVLFLSSAQTIIQPNGVTSNQKMFYLKNTNRPLHSSLY